MTESEARQKGEKLLSQMHGTGWKLDVWENLGWHYAVYNGPLSVYPSEYKSKVTYSALLNDENIERSGGANFWYSDLHYNNPNEAMIEQLKIARNKVNSLDEIVNGLEYNIGLPTKDEIISFLKEIEPRFNDSLGEMGCNMIQNAVDEISERFDLTEEAAEKLMNKIGVGITFEYE